MNPNDFTSRYHRASRILIPKRQASRTVKIKNTTVSIYGAYDVTSDYIADDDNRWITGDLYVTWFDDDNNGDVYVPIGCWTQGDPNLADGDPPWSAKDEGTHILAAIFNNVVEKQRPSPGRPVNKHPIIHSTEEDAETVGKIACEMLANAWHRKQQRR